MKVILLEKIKSLGDLGEEIVVKSGFARNYLFPKYKAILFSKRNRQFLDRKIQDIEKNDVLNEGEEEKLEKLIKKANLVLEAKSKNDGKLVRPVTKKNITEIFKKSKIPVRQGDIELNANIDKLGSYNIFINLRDKKKIEKELSVIKK